MGTSGVLKVRRQVVAQVALCPAVAFALPIGHLLAQPGHLADQLVDLVLLADDDLVELVEQVFGVGGFDLKVCQALVTDVGVLHAPIGHEKSALA
jgi:hypothetical protein